MGTTRSAIETVPSIAAAPNPGVDRVEWDGRDGGGRETAAGVYFVRWTQGDATAREKVVRLPAR